MNELSLGLRIPLALAAFAVMFLPMWWAIGRLKDDVTTPFLRLLAAIFAATIGWLSFVNLVGRALGTSYTPAIIWLAINTLVTAFLLATRRHDLSLTGIFTSWRAWAPTVIIAVAFGAPQWLYAVSTPYWDEVASSAIHLTGPIQFAEGVYPPRHNSFPEVPVKYHYASTTLAGTVKWATGLSANNCVDIVSTSLHLFVFLFLFHWLAQLGFRRLAALWGSFSVLLGGGLAWLYVRSLETYSGFPKRGEPGALVHKFKDSLDYWSNLRDAAKTAVFHLHNGDGTNSNLPWDIANQWQQHGVAVGIAFAIFAAWLFCTWMRQPGSRALMIAATATFGVLTLGHAVFGTVTCLTAGLLFVMRWLDKPSARGLIDGVLFVAGVGVLSFAHGGVLSRGDVYGANLTTMVVRDSVGYWEGGLAGFLHWNLAGFGIPLILAVYAMVQWRKHAATASEPRRLAFWFFAIMLAVSYLPAQLIYYSYGGKSVEEHTEIAKFFFVTHLALGVLSSFAIVLAARRVPWHWAPPAFLAMAIVPLFHIHAATFDGEGQWTGYYDSPYPSPVYDDARRLAKVLYEQKSGPFDVYFDGEWDEEHRRAFVDELQIHGGSNFSITPRRYERTGSFLIDQTYVGERVRKHGRMARMLPGAEIEPQVQWIYGRDGDYRRFPPIVRTRFAKNVAEGTFQLAHREGPRVLYRIVKPTTQVDEGIERWLKPRAVAPSRGEIAFYDRKAQEIVLADKRIPLPASHRDDFMLVLTGAFGRGPNGDFAVARMADTYFFRGASITEMVEYNPWYWTQPEAGGWTKEARRWGWDHHVPLVADLEGSGKDELIAFHRGNGEWFRGDRLLMKNVPAKGPDVLPAVGRFVPGAGVMLATFSKGTWQLVPKDAKDPAGAAVKVEHGAIDDVIVPGDYDGDKVDELAVWRPSDGTWRVRNPVSGAVTVWTFGSATSVPVPYDYDHDGKLDLAYWQPAEREIRVSFDHGKTVARTISVPADALPAFVNMY